MKTVAILDGQTIQTLPVSKSLKKLGYRVILLCESSNSYGYHTKYADEKLIAPSTKEQSKKFHKFIFNFLHHHKVDYIIPMNDYSALFMSRYKSELQNFCDFIIPDYDVFMTGYDKNKLMKVCFENNFPHPKSSDLSLDSLSVASHYVGFPALIKPNETTGARGFAIINCEDELYKKLPEIQKEFGNCHLQEYIPMGGQQFKVELFINENQLINATVIHKIRFYPKKGGSSCYNQTVERNDLVKLCFNVLKEINWIGFADFDLIEDPRDGIIKIMEINPRIPACIRASFNAGVDFVENIIKVSSGSSPTKYKYLPGSYLRYFGLDLLWFLGSKNRFKTQPSWFKGFFSSKHYLQDGSWDDPKPFIYGTIGGFLKQLNPKFRATKKGMN